MRRMIPQISIKIQDGQVELLFYFWAGLAIDMSCSPGDASEEPVA